MRDERSATLAPASGGSAPSRKMTSRIVTVIGCATAIALIAIRAGAAEPRSAKVSSEPKRLHRWTDLSWDHTDFPLFSLHGPFDRRPDSSSIPKVLRETKDALNVYGFREVVLADDEKSITMTLKEEDAKMLKILTSKSTHGWFVAIAPPKHFSAGAPSVAVLAIGPAMPEGRIVFSQQEAGAIAQNLRYRFRIAEFRLEP